MENISRNLPNICTFSFVRHSKYNRPRGARSSCAYACACTHDVIQDGAEKADERRKMLFLSPLSTTGSPRLGCVLLTSNAIIDQGLERFPHLRPPISGPPSQAPHLRPPISDPPSQTPHLRHPTSDPLISGPLSQAPHLRPPISDPPSQAPHLRPPFQDAHIEPPANLRRTITTMSGPQ